MKVVAGRRKRSVARVLLNTKDKNIVVNGKALKDYFPREAHSSEIMRPLKVVELADKIGVSVNVVGGGSTGQAEATRHAIAKALLVHNPGYRAALKKDGLLTVDARKVEPKKAGYKKSRKKPQFSKR